MSAGHAYRFETKQLGLCLRVPLPERLFLSPGGGTDLPPLAPGTSSVALSADGEWLWIDSTGAVRRDEHCAGPVTGPALRMLFDRRWIWILTAEELHRIDPGSLQLLGSSERGDVVDIAPDGSGGVWLLTAKTIEHLDCNGRALPPPTPRGLTADSIAAVGEVIALLTKSTNSLTLIAKCKLVEIQLGDVLGDEGPPFKADLLSSSDRGFLLEGDWDGRHGVLLLDRNGGPCAWGTWDDGGHPTALAAGADLYAVFAENGQLIPRRFSGAAEAGGIVWLTPALESDSLAGDWLRADVAALLPERATISMRWASTTNEGLRDTADVLARDESKPVGVRAHTLRSMLDWSQIWRTYTGRPKPDSADEPAIESFAFPLHEAQGKGHILWIELAIHRNRAAEAPELHGIVVRHDAPSLMDNLPAVYRSPEGDQDGLMRRLIAVLEATTQDLDKRISQLADRLDPARTEDRWLPGLASLLGLPFHDSLEPGQQRRIVQAARRILAGRGTRGGVAALLGALFPDRAFRVVDLTERLSPIVVGGGDTPGAALPAFLSGPSANVARLNARLVLGRTGLCSTSPGDRSSVVRPPELLVEIAATPREQRRYATAVRHMVEAMLPAGVRLRLRWTTGARGMGERVAIIRDPEPMVLGNATPIRRIRVGGDRRPRIREDGTGIGHRLQ